MRIPARWDEVLLKSCDHFDSEVQNALNSATTMIQPIILIIMGGSNRRGLHLHLRTDSLHYANALITEAKLESEF